MRGSKVVANCKKQFKKLAPHEMESRQMIVEDHPVITMAVSFANYILEYEDDTLKMTRNPGCLLINLLNRS